MTPLPQFPAGIPQSQFEFFRAVTAKAFSSAERVIALNLNTSRASVERSSNTFRQLLQINDPRDLMQLTSQPQQELQSLLAYSRELLSIVADVGLKLPASAAAPVAAPVAAPAATPFVPTAIRSAPPAPAAPESIEDAVAEQVAKASKGPVVAAVAEPSAEPVAEAKPLAKAMAKAAPKPAEHPLAAPVAPQHEIELPAVKPVEAAPPPVQVSGTPAIDVRQAEAARGKAARKK
jgi:hypothetical protein